MSESQLTSRRMVCGVTSKCVARSSTVTKPSRCTQSSSSCCRAFKVMRGSRVMASKSALFCLEVARIVRDRPGGPAMLDRPSYLWISLSNGIDATTPTSALRLGSGIKSDKCVTRHYTACHSRAACSEVARTLSIPVHIRMSKRLLPTSPVRIACFAFSAATREDGKIDGVESERGLPARNLSPAKHIRYEKSLGYKAPLTPSPNRFSVAYRNVPVSARESSVTCVIATRFSAVRFMLF